MCDCRSTHILTFSLIVATADGWSFNGLFSSLSGLREDDGELEVLEENSRLFFNIFNITSTTASLVSPTYALLIVLGGSAILLFIFILLYFLVLSYHKKHSYSDYYRSIGLPRVGFGSDSPGIRKRSVENEGLSIEDWISILEAIGNLNEHFAQLGLVSQDCKYKFVCLAASDMRNVSPLNSMVANTVNRLRLQYISATEEGFSKSELTSLKIGRNYLLAEKQGRADPTSCQKTFSSCLEEVNGRSRV